MICFLNLRRLRHLPTYARREFAADGGLMTYGASLPYAYHVMGTYLGLREILKGTKPSELPVVQPEI